MQKYSVQIETVTVRRVFVHAHSESDARRAAIEHGHAIIRVVNTILGDTKAYSSVGIREVPEPVSE